MSDLTIGRLTATVGDWPDTDPDHVPRMLRHMADTRLQDAVRAHPFPGGEWCVRRVDVDVELDPERPDSALEADWANQIVVALRRSLRDGSLDVVRYERSEQAVDDLLAGLATGDHDRAWAWLQVGVLAAGDPEPGAASRELCLRVIERTPFGVAAALGRLVERVGASVAHRLLGSEGWIAAAELAAGQPGVTASPLQAATARTEPPDRTVDPSVNLGSSFARRATAVATMSPLATALRGSSLRPDDATLRAWAVLVMAGSDPTGLRCPESAGLVRALAELLRPATAVGLGATSPRGTRRGGQRDRAPADQTISTSHAASDQSSHHSHDLNFATPPSHSAGKAGDNRDVAAIGRHDADSAPDESVVGARTAWGGLLFLLNTAADAGLPDSLDEPPFLDRPTPWLVQQLCVRLVPALPDNPAVLAFSNVGLDVPGDQLPPDASEAAALDRCAARWAAATASRLRPRVVDTPSDLELVRMLARRDATVLREPGWVEVVLRLDDVDLDIRHSGLDIDPGWIWWLGQVVRFLYE
ncbi:hypothetical protein EV649_5082 [Kribbella sp. VKM Ac-2569]|uniref:hypothetical protein n=1 Tax=Kribbella sp. VKM Ac-2569 TaxID=2512220 RepID=UPI0010EA93E1|nr:hypothetical protein [Kribbella sp. VKM Ac-2569]RZT17535.1 hypothetical protein EV649_5082 [Kribbella sp. VKM Ac-2569]